MAEEENTPDNFAFTGGRFCLDFINTLSDRHKTVPVEVLNSYADLLTWSRLAQILDPGQVTRLRDHAIQQPLLAARWLTEARRLRAVLFRIFSAVANGQVAPAEEIGAFNRFFAETTAHLRLVPARVGFAWQWDDAEQHPELPLWLIARDAADLLTSPAVDSVRMCASDDCDWLFLDTSKNHSRRWCDMKSCGNRAKVRRYYTRQKQTGKE